MNNFNTRLHNMIYVNNQIIPSNICDFIISKIEQREWSKHYWYDNSNNCNFSYDDKELDIQQSTPDLDQILCPFIQESITNYSNNYLFNVDSVGLFNKFSIPRFNRYSKGQMMRLHYDHIKFLFDGNEKGIPVLSIIINFNEDYEGGELYFWEDYTINLKKGDIVIFPSVFLFPHGVKDIIHGKRYSAVSWVW